MMGDVPPEELRFQQLIGREDELHELLRLVGLTGDDPEPHPRSVIVAGDAGVGKSRLLAELRAHADDSEWLVLIGHCLDFGDSALPYLPFSEIFGRLPAETATLAETVARTHPAVRRLMPGRRVTSDVEPRSVEPTDRADLFEAVHATLEHLAETSPVLVLVEDLHWADQSTREMLSFLFARRFMGPVSMVATYRSDDLHRRHPLRTAVAEWSRLPGVARLQLDPLSDLDIRSLVQALHPQPLPERDVHEIVARAEGNAFFTEELVGAAGRDAHSLPDDLADLLLLRIEQLDDNGRLAVRAASAAGRRVSHELLSLVVDLEPRALDLALRAAVDSYILLPAGSDSYAFRHALLGEAVYDDLLPGERVRLHRAYTVALGDGGVASTAAEIARHARASHDIQTAVRASIEAGDEAMSVGGPDEAAHHYQVALELVAEPHPDQHDLSLTDLVDLSIKAGEAVAVAGHPLRSVQLLDDQVRQLCDKVSDDDSFRLRLALATAALVTDTNVDPLAITTELVDQVPKEPPTPLRARLLGIHARALAGRKSDDEVLRFASAALTLGQEMRLQTVVTDAMTTMTRLDERSGDPEASRKALAAIVSQAREAGDAVSELRGLHNLGGVSLEAGHIATAQAAYNDAIKRAVELGRPWAPYGLDSRVLAGITAYIGGYWDESLRITDVTGEAPPAPAEAALVSVALLVAAGRGDHAALERAPRVRKWWDKDGMLAITSGGAAIDLRGDNGDLEGALAAHDHVVEVVTRLWQVEWFFAQVRLAALMIGQLATYAADASTADREAMAVRGEQLAETANETLNLAKRRLRKIGPEGLAWVARARAEHLRLRWVTGSDAPSEDELVAAWEEAVAGFETLGHRFEIARSQARLAAVMRAAGHTVEARPHVEAARSAARELGAEPLLKELRALGAAAPRRAADSRRDEQLTTREREILTHVAAGRTNGEIAKQLYISAKTVSVHVSNILAKLGAAGRTEAAAVARRQGLLDDELAGR